MVPLYVAKFMIHTLLAYVKHFLAAGYFPRFHSNRLPDIENNLSARRVPWDTICFHAQQTAG